MTTIRVRFVPPGSDSPVEGQVRFAPRHFEPGRPIADGADVLIGDTGWVDVTDETTRIEVRPTGSGWYYAVQGRAGSHRFSTNVLVPPAGEHDFESLVRVDPKAGGLEYEPDPEWRADLDSIRYMGGIPGQDGSDAYQVAVREGFTGTEQEWLDSLVGPRGDRGERGDQGPRGERGPEGPRGEKGDPGGLTEESQEVLDNAISEVENATRVTTRFRPGDEAQFRILDQASRIAFGVAENGDTLVGDSRLAGSDSAWRIMDQHGQVALEVNGSGRTYIHDLTTLEQGVTELHAFLAAGQSNMSGRGLPFGEGYDAPNTRVMEYGAKDRRLRGASVPLDMHDVSRALSPATVFAEEYLSHQPPHVGVLLVPAAHGGTAFTTEETDGLTWTKGMATDPANALYEKSVTQAQEALTAAEDAGYEVTLKAVLWHQGEGNGGMSQQEYAGYLDQLIEDYRADLGSPDLPVVVGQMAPEGTSAYATRTPIDRAHADTPARLERVGFATAEWDSTNYDDMTHFSRDGVVSLGREYLRGYHQAVANTPTGQPKKPRGVTAIRDGSDVRVSWGAPLCRVTGYTVEYTDAGGTWTEVARTAPMNLHETITNMSAPIRVRVTAHEGESSSGPTRPVPVTGA